MKNTNIQIEAPEYRIRTPRSAYDALVAERSFDEGFDPEQVALVGFVPLVQPSIEGLPQEVSCD